MKNNIGAYIKTNQKKPRPDRGKPHGAARPAPATHRRGKERGR